MEISKLTLFALTLKASDMGPKKSNFELLYFCKSFLQITMYTPLK